MRSDLREVWRYRDLLLQLVRRDLRVRYKNSRIGFLWSLAPPLLQILVITVMVKRFLKMDIPNYSAYVFVVMFPWTFFNLAVQDSTTALLFHGAVVKKTYFPREILPLSSVISNLIHFLISMGLVFAYLAFLGIFPGRMTASALWLPVLILAQTALILGMGLALSCLTVFFEDIRYIITVFMTLFLYVNPIIYSIEQVPSEWYPWYMLNPLASLLVAYRKVLLGPLYLPVPAEEAAAQEALGRTPGWLPPPPPQNGHFFHAVRPLDEGYLALAMLVCFLVLVGGYWLFNRYKWEIPERL